MSSILTNNGAMVALQTLKSINSSLADTQNQISTGKSVATAKDNAAVWAISKVMESDVKGFKAISDSLSLGQSTVAVARQASETVTDLLTQMKGKIVAAQEDNVDRAKINADVTALRSQIDTVVKSAQFNGLNLVNGTSGNINVLSSLNRDSAGAVTTDTIQVIEQDLSIGGFSAAAVFNTNTDGITVAGAAFASTVAAAGTADIEFDGDVVAAGDTINIRLGEEEVSYTVTAADVASTSKDETLAINLKKAIEDAGITGITVDYDATSPDVITITNGSGAAMNISGNYENVGAGGLGAISGYNVSTAGGAQAALASIETLIGRSIDAAASFGSVEGRIQTQNNFITSLSDSLRSGIGAMVDADMEEASARLQALQVQQQLGVQALSIANQAPQSLLSLFR